MPKPSRSDVGAEVEDDREREQESGDEDGPLEGPPQPRSQRGSAECVPDPRLEVRPEDEQADDERGREQECRDDDACEQTRANEPPRVLAAERDGDPFHQGRCGRRRRPDRECEAEDGHDDAGARRLGRAAQAVAQKRRRLLGHHRLRAVDERLDGRGVGDERKDAECDEHRGGDREEEGVRERLRDQRHVVLPRLRHRAAKHDPRVREKRLHPWCFLDRARGETREAARRPPLACVASVQAGQPARRTWTSR